MRLLMNLIFIAFAIGAVFGVSVSAATLTVNDNLSGVVCNQTLSLAEAAQFAGDGVGLRNLTDGEKAQISGVTWLAFPPEQNCAGAIWRAAVNGGVGRFVEDFIFFSNAVTQINDAVVLGRNDNLSGLKPNGTKVILDGTGLGNTSGVTFTSFNDQSTSTTGSDVRYLVIRNFGRNGINASFTRGSVMEGLEIYNNGLNGISLIGSETNARTIRIGGGQPEHRNLIYGNGQNGISVTALPNNDRFPDQNIQILNNYIGTQNGTSDNGNGGNGIYLENAFGVVVGDPTGATRNVISGNNGDGIKIIGEKAVSNEIIGNFIGTDASGGAALGNTFSGVALLAGAGFAADFVNTFPNRIGKPGLGNVISRNNYGIFIADNNTSNNWVQSNSVGTNVGGNTDLGNTLDGVLVGGGTFDNQIGGTGVNEGNLLAFNRRGIFADGGIRNSFRRNRVFSNDELGIDLAPVGVTANDAGDGDTGPNNLLNFPAITYVNAQNSTVRLEGTYSGAPNQTFTLEFFGNTAIDSTGNGEGRNFLGQTTVTTNGSGSATFNVEFAAAIANTGTFVTATATDSTNNTSEYSSGRNICADVRLSPNGQVFTASGGTSSFTVIQSAGCTSTPQSNAAWITVTGSSAGTVNYSVASHTGAQRSGAILVNFNNGSFFTFATFNITQFANLCAYSLSPASANVAAGGGNTSFNVSTAAGCGWLAESNANWISITGGSSGTGNGTVSISVAPNTGPPRSGTVFVNGQTFTVNQSGCSFTLSQTSVFLGALGEHSFAFTVTPSSGGCTWDVFSNNSWITIEGPMSRSGSGTVIFTAASSQGQNRTGTISVGGQTFTVNQAAACFYEVTPSSQSQPASGGSGSFQVNTQPGCGWRVVSPAAWLTITSGSTGVGSGSINYTVSALTGNGRGALFSLDDQLFQVNQQPGCGFDASVLTARFPVTGGNGNFNVTNATGCSWIAGTATDWITVTSQSSNTGNQTVAYTVAANTTRAPRIGTIQILHNGQPVRTVTVTQTSGNPGFDFDGDGRTDISVFRPSNGQWWLDRSSAGLIVHTFGNSTDRITPGDFTGDGVTDVAIFRPSNGNWFVLRSENFTFYSFPFGANGDLPAPGDYDGDGRTDAAVFRPSTTTWFIQNSGGGTSIFNFGAANDKPVPADYDGDGRTDVAIWRPSLGQWWYQRSSTGQVLAFTFGLATDRPVPGDFTGDGKADVAFWRPSTGEWFILRSEDFTFYSFPFGTTGDIPAPGDYDGDGRFDSGVFRPSSATWFINRTQAGLLITGFGAGTDLPVPSAFVP